MLEAETKRLEEMARSFALFGRLPEGPRAPVDVGELVRSRDAKRGAGGDAGGGGRGGGRADGRGARRRAGPRAHQRAVERGGGEHAGRAGRGDGSSAPRWTGGRWSRWRCTIAASGFPENRLGAHLGAVRDAQAGRHGTRARDRAADTPRARRRSVERRAPPARARRFDSFSRRRRRASLEGCDTWRLMASDADHRCSRSMPIMAIGFPLARAYAKRIEQGGDAPRIPVRRQRAAGAHGAGDRLDRGGGRAHLGGAALHDEAAVRAERRPAGGDVSPPVR